MHDLISRAGVIQVPCLSSSAQRLVVYLGVLEKSCFFTSVSVMGNSFVFVDVSMEIVHGKFTSGNGGHSRISVLPR